MEDVLNGGLLLCRLPKGILGEDTARILGSLIVARTWQAAIARARIPEDERRDATLYIDECHNFLTLPGSIDDMLAKPAGSASASSWPPRPRPAAQGDAGRPVGQRPVEDLLQHRPGDARELSKHTKPELDEHDLAHLDVHTAAARLLVGNRELPAFTFTTHAPPELVGEATAIRQACAAAHTPPTDEPPMQQIARAALRRRNSPPSS